ICRMVDFLFMAERLRSSIVLEHHRERSSKRAEMRLDTTLQRPSIGVGFHLSSSFHICRNGFVIVTENMVTDFVGQHERKSVNHHCDLLLVPDWIIVYSTWIHALKCAGALNKRRLIVQ